MLRKITLLLLAVLMVSFYAFGQDEEGCSDCSSCSAGCSDSTMEIRADAEMSVKRNFFQRLLGIPATKNPVNNACWTYNDGILTIDLNKSPELKINGGAFRIDDESLPEKAIIIHGDDGKYYAFRNKCTHSGRMLDPVPGGFTVQCCSIGKSTWDYTGKLLSGSAKGDLKSYPVECKDNMLYISMK